MDDGVCVCDFGVDDDDVWMLCVCDVEMVVDDDDVVGCGGFVNEWCGVRVWCCVGWKLCGECGVRGGFGVFFGWWIDVCVWEYDEKIFVEDCVCVVWWVWGECGWEWVYVDVGFVSVVDGARIRIGGKYGVRVLRYDGCGWGWL